MFVGRGEELRLLNDLLEKESPAVAVVYGRRRIGKTELIKKALEKKDALLFEGLEHQGKKQQIDNFLLQLSRQIPHAKRDVRIKTWREAFLRLDPHLKKRSMCIVLDEFQWLANYRTAAVSDLKMVWEQYLSRRPGIKLILCGSLASFMTTNVVKSSALYGRTDLVVHLKGFHLSETAEMLPGRGVDEVLEAQMLFGGVPKYLDLVVDSPSVLLAMEELAFRDHGYFLDEFDRIFTSHFGRNPAYKKIVVALASRPYGLFRKEIAERASLDLGGGLSEYLQNLESAGFISSATPFDKGSSTRLIKYHLSDAYLRFYFSCIQPNLKKIRSGIHKNLFAGLRQTSRFSGWRGRAFEYLCLDHVARITEILGFSGIEFSFGPFFRSPRKDKGGVQIDLVFDRADNVITLCEMKSGTSPLGVGVAKEVQRKEMVLRQAYPSRTIQKVLVVCDVPSKELVNSGYFYRIIRAEELAGR